MKNRITIYLTAPTNLLWGALGFISAIILILFGAFEGTSAGDTLKFCIMSFVLMTIIVYFIGSQQDKIVDKPYFNSVLIGSYIVALIMILAIHKPDENLLWMASGLVIAILYDMQIGLLLTYNLIIIASFIGKLNTQSIVFLMIIGTLMCMLSNSMKTITTLGYAIIIILSVQITLMFIVNNFYLWDILKIDAVYNMLSILFAIVLAHILFLLYRDKVFKLKEATSISDLNNLATIEQELYKHSDPSLNGTNVMTVSDIELPGTHTYEEIIDKEFPLLLKLKERSQNLYNKSLYVGDLCENAAASIGVNEIKAKAGGMYYHIGLIDSKQYVESGIKLVEDYHMPVLIKDIIFQHNLKYDKPKTPEAAIVMLAVSILSTKDFFELKRKKDLESGKVSTPISLSKIVEHVFLLRLSKGSLDESGITLKQYNELKTYFLQM